MNKRICTKYVVIIMREIDDVIRVSSLCHYNRRALVRATSAAGTGFITRSETKKTRHSAGENRNYSSGACCTRRGENDAYCVLQLLRSKIRLNFVGPSQVRVRVQYSCPIVDFRITNIRYWGGGLGGQNPPRKRAGSGGRSRPGNGNVGVTTRASPNAVEAHHPLFLLICFISLNFSYFIYYIY
jgi:hypothetical protein